MAPRRAEEFPLKRVAALGCRLPSRLPAGEILTDITGNLWRLGNSIGCGGFGDVYLASNDIHKSVGQNTKYVIKIEPHNNGPLFVEMNFYIRAARKQMIDEWCKIQNLRQVGIPSYEGSGSHIYKNERYRFLVIPRYGQDVGKLFISNGRKLSKKLINSLAVQMLYALEYIHSKGYAHSDVKGSNILLKKNYDYSSELEKTRAFLVDYGLAYRFRTSNGAHKPFFHDERRAHEGTLEFTSRDAHHGTHSRRGDLETLGYNLLQWLCGKLPWEDDNGGLSPSANPDEIHDKKENYLLDVDSFMKACFQDKKPPENITNYMKYITNLKFESEPDYAYLRSLFRQDMSFESLFGKRKSFANENSAAIEKRNNRPNLRERKPCKPLNREIRITRNTPSSVEQDKEIDDFRWEEVLARHPDRLAKISAQPPSSPLTPPPSPPPPTLPTYAMLAVLQRMKERQTGLVRQRTNSKSSDNELKAKWMTPAMEEVALLRKKNQEQLDNNVNETKRLTRSRVAQLKRKRPSSGKQQESKNISNPNAFSCCAA
ncbi:serine/threonine-protein kinase VRK1-like [Copidosoma floridanum]|uniref:serine/threonine-protein kinase VRK1-like n=1 Tax=Copidosoma floridanum TaxID=29053 RepID=UPI0006C973D7|nr:serine/threonine-protein kinase VRK1-like [Copidosoma floridanum]